MVAKYTLDLVGVRWGWGRGGGFPIGMSLGHKDTRVMTHMSNMSQKSTLEIANVLILALLEVLIS